MARGKGGPRLPNTDFRCIFYGISTPEALIGSPVGVRWGTLGARNAFSAPFRLWGVLGKFLVFVLHVGDITWGSLGPLGHPPVPLGGSLGRPGGAEIVDLTAPVQSNREVPLERPGGSTGPL